MSLSKPKRQIDFDTQANILRGRFRAMGSPCEVLLASSSQSQLEEITQLVATEAWRIEDKFSRFLPDNIVATINTADGEGITVDEETANLLDFSAQLYELSEHRFDISSGVLREAWTFDGSDRVPSAAAVRAILPRVGWHQANWQRPLIRLPTGMQIDFGGVGKEYAVDRAAALVVARTEARCLLNFGGDLIAVGRDSRASPWQVGIEALDAGTGSAAKRVDLEQGALATSGDARRFLLKNGQRYGHILDPLTGWPVAGAPRSITVAADTCTQAGMLATLAMLQGETAESFLREQGHRFWCLR